MHLLALISLCLTPFIVAVPNPADGEGVEKRCTPRPDFCSSGSYISIVPATTTTYPPPPCPSMTCVPVITTPTASTPLPDPIITPFEMK
ncbi:hypothetical protein CC2G_006576 [Coprinopsis cinerea AmutBmut pab1-1]|nr:hypothetical protein CC2G_006576 [Coprinopsis cinerea AmutBmut pab1-1]